MRHFPTNKPGACVDGGLLGGGKPFHSSPSAPQGGKSLKARTAWVGKPMDLNFCILGLNVNTLIASFPPDSTSCGRILNGDEGCGGIRVGEDLLRGQTL